MRPSVGDQLLERARDAARPVLGPACRRIRREAQWHDPRARFAHYRDASGPFPHRITGHATPLVRPLAGLDPQLQSNKAVNLAIAAGCIDGLVVAPGERFSFWLLVGRPTRARGFLDGLVLDHGALSRGIGGGLCQMTNLLYWMSLHTPLTVVERWRHSYDVFPDAGRTQPFGTGATCAWPVLDLQIENRTTSAYRLSVGVTPTELQGAWEAMEEFPGAFEVYERAHVITHEGAGRYIRHNQVWRQEFSAGGRLVGESPITENHALLMYSPFLGAAVDGTESSEPSDAPD